MNEMSQCPKFPAWRNVARTAWPVLLVVLLTLPALQPLWQPGLQQTDDGAHHVFRLFSLDRAQRAGYFASRWQPEEGFGYGFPVLNFYAPLSYFFGLLFHRLGAGFVTSFEWSLAAGLVLAALAMYLFARELLGRWGGALAAVAYAWAPYHLADAWMRGALAEHLAFIWLPLLLLALLRISRASGREGWWPALWGGMVVAGLILTHNLTVLLAAPAVAAWALLLLFVGLRAGASRSRFLGQCIVAGLLGLLLSAAFWLPAITESQFVRAGHIPEAFADWSQTLERPAYLLGASWDHRYVTERGIEHRVGLAQAVLAVAGLVVGLSRRRRLSPVAAWTLPVMAGLTLLALFMQSQLSAAVWRIPGLLLLQFPWRWQALAVVSTALLTGYLGLVIPEGVSRDAPRSTLPDDGATTGSLYSRLLAPLLLILVALLLASAALPNLPWQPMNIPATDTPATDATITLANVAMYDYGRGLWLREHGSPWMFEYMPVWVQTPREEFFLPDSSADTRPDASGNPLPMPITVTPGRQTPLAHEYTVNAPAAWTLQLHQFYFPGWEAVIDGRAQPASPVGPLGLAGATVPAGEHRVTFRFGSTPPRRIGWILSLVALAGWLAAAMWLRPRRSRVPLALLATVVVIYAALTWSARLVRPSDFTPATVTANFDGQVQLVGYHAPDASLRPGRANAVVLHWLALAAPAVNYKVFVHLIDATGKLYAQHDGEPGFFFSPMTRWQSGEIVDDTHILQWQADPPPGHYQLRAGLYDPATGARLALLGPDGQPVADQVLLAEFEIP